DRFVAIYPSKPLGLKVQRSLVRPRPHDVAVDRFKKGVDERRVHGLPVRKLIGSFEPVDAPVLSSNEAVQTRRHVNRYTRITACHNPTQFPIYSGHKTLFAT